MPIVFIHGVNTRDGDSYRVQEAQRNALLKAHVLEPLAQHDARFRDMAIVSPYWGHLGVVFGWGQATLPSVSVLEHLGEDDSLQQLARAERSERIERLAEVPAEPGTLEPLGASGRLKAAALADLSQFIDVLLTPGPGEAGERLRASPAEDAAVLGEREALLLTAGHEVAADPATQRAIESVTTDDEVLAILKSRIQARFLELLEVSQPLVETPSDELEPLGPAEWAGGVLANVGSMVDRLKNLPGRLVTLAALDLQRDAVHRNFSQFMGDVFIYLTRRDHVQGAEQIWEHIRDAIRSAPRNSDGEPTVVITHSMGGNILYDILTHYDTSLTVDFWASVGGQVGQFEEMKIFKASNAELVAPEKVSGLKPRVGYWLNVYDPADIFGFKAAPVFDDVDADCAFVTGAAGVDAHGAYFRQVGFYELLRSHLEKALP